jgi:[ribosomal protein S5]-alanine N-acetyltransferase
MPTENFNIVFQTERLIVRTYNADDKENFFLMNGDEEIVRYIRAAKSREECDRFLLEVIKYSDENPLFGRWAVHEKETGNFAGTFAIIPVEGTDHLQLGYSLLKTAWGKGYATELTKAGIAYFFEKTLLNELHALTQAENIPSQKVLLKSGFIQSGSVFEEGKDILEFIYKRSGV